MELILYLILLVASLAAISRAADLFIDSATGLGSRFGLTEYLVGSLLVGVGTSLPELVTSLSALLQRQPALVAPNIYGTVIANILAGLGLSALLLGVVLKKGRLPKLFSLRLADGPTHLDFRGANALDAAVPIAIFSVLLSLLLCADGRFSRADAIVFLICYLTFLRAEMQKIPTAEPIESAPASEEVAEEPAQPRPERRTLGGVVTLFASRAMRRTIANHLALLICFGILAAFLTRVQERLDAAIVITLASLAAVLVLDFAFAATWRHAHPELPFDQLKEAKLAESGMFFLVAYLVVSLILVFAAGDLIIEGVIQTSSALGLQATTLTASLVAFGTSLPDILVAVKIAKRGWHRMLIGHILQSNVFDVLFIMAVCGMITPLPIDTQTLMLTIPAAVATHLMLLATLQDQRISASEGSFLLVSYIAFVAVLFGLI